MSDERASRLISPFVRGGRVAELPIPAITSTPLRTTSCMIQPAEMHYRMLWMWSDDTCIACSCVGRYSSTHGHDCGIRFGISFADFGFALLCSSLLSLSVRRSHLYSYPSSSQQHPPVVLSPFPTTVTLFNMAKAIRLFAFLAATLSLTATVSAKSGLGQACE